MKGAKQVSEWEKNEIRLEVYKRIFAAKILEDKTVCEVAFSTEMIHSFHVCEGLERIAEAFNLSMKKDDVFYRIDIDGYDFYGKVDIDDV